MAEDLTFKDYVTQEDDKKEKTRWTSKTNIWWFCKSTR